MVEAAGVGYEVFIPPVVQRALADAKAGVMATCADEVAAGWSTITPRRTSPGQS